MKVWCTPTDLKRNKNFVYLFHAFNDVPLGVKMHA